MQPESWSQDLVLLGGGHAHVEVLRSFGMRPVPGVRLTLVTRDIHTPYSGMLPGYVSGFYTHDECHIDLAQLSTFAQARLVHATAEGVDIKTRHVLIKGRPAIAYDALSIDIGIVPRQNDIPGSLEHTTPVKPINGFVKGIDELLLRYRKLSDPSVATRVVVVGGGPGGVEIAMSLQHRLEEERVKAGRLTGAAAHITLVSRGAVLASLNSYTRAKFASALRKRCITVVEGCGGVTAVAKGVLQLAKGEQVHFDECLWCTDASAAEWLRDTGLPTDKDGFLAINEELQSDGGPPEVFASGDVASSAKHPRPKAGVYAVRQGPPLAENLRCFLTERPLRPFTPQRSALSLITTGSRSCVATRGWLSLQGDWLWLWKDHIDRTFMARYSTDLPDMSTSSEGSSSSSSSGSSGGGGGSSQGSGSKRGIDGVAGGAEGLAILAASKMRCGGCGGKVRGVGIARS
ncbi:MAG: hypothetical protein WDW38_002754 [Sanguina aurantia]